MASQLAAVEYDAAAPRAMWAGGKCQTAGGWYWIER
jgi:NADH:ubiquinone oxidoreductase subunit B-like Fe-S oxidoreductase